MPHSQLCWWCWLRAAQHACEAAPALGLLLLPLVLPLLLLALLPVLVLLALAARGTIGCVMVDGVLPPLQAAHGHRRQVQGHRRGHQAALVTQGPGMREAGHTHSTAVNYKLMLS